MTTVSGTGAPTAYELRVQGHLDDHWSTWFDLGLTRHDDGTSTLAGSIADQAQLHGVLARLRDLGLTLLTLQTLGATATDQAPTATPEQRPVLEQPVHTERLTLRPATPADADITFEYRRLEPVGRWLTEIPTDRETYRATFSTPARLATTVIIERDGATIGDFMLRVEDAWAQAEVAGEAVGAQAELGWVLDPGHVGHGYATEAVRGLLGVCFDNLGVRRVIANCFADNDTSRRLMERVGMRREGHAVRESLHRSGRWLDTVTYALLVDEWEGTSTRKASAAKHRPEPHLA